MEQSCGPLAVEMFPGKHWVFRTYLAKRARAQSGACAEVQFPDYGSVLWASGSRNGSRKALGFQHISYQERELSLEHAQKCSFLIMEQSCGPLAVETIPGKHCDFRTYLTKRARAQSGACTEVKFPYYGTLLWSPVSSICSRKHCDFSTYLAKRARAQSGACAEMHFPDYGTALWSPGSRKCSRKALRFQQLPYQGNESSVCRMSRGAVS
jgi:hypothetical protein